MRQKQILPPTYFWVFFLLMIGLHFLFPLMKVIVSPYNYLGILLIVIGLWFNVWSSNFFKKVKTAIKPFEESSYLVTEGLFKYSRHPMYLGMLLALVGLFILLGSITPLFAIPIFMWMITKKFILIEEKALEEKFGKDYLEYKDEVRRWI
ncbi:MAG: isoprenylcysteine carboxylmethyltransferase family protein [candidate division Zixibacteria bacterium]|nr:isoprenylcysteine carboxylmethyltransferase family protein [candidate division Zixibacteria bacterium]